MFKHNIDIPLLFCTVGRFIEISSFLLSHSHMVYVGTAVRVVWMVSVLNCVPSCIAYGCFLDICVVNKLANIDMI